MSRGANAWNLGQGGVTNFTKSEGQRFARQILQSQTYRDWLEERVKTKTLDSAVERMLWSYAYGKPPEHMTLTVQGGVEDLSQMSLAELLEMNKQITEQLEEAQAIKDALPADVLKGPW